MKNAKASVTQWSSHHENSQKCNEQKHFGLKYGYGSLVMVMVSRQFCRVPSSAIKLTLPPQASMGIIQKSPVRFWFLSFKPFVAAQ